MQKARYKDDYTFFKEGGGMGTEKNARRGEKVFSQLLSAR